ncbi:hypothetical protein AVEN_83289-1 [Araneus ventricosus]|uniref:Mutator-like transposase domain-containing protein n=1 Tax=Araneus ventricosus TaxID=182803 RepID=A0A4Y2T8U5_ARAVE|nr:hypothetical protein AVEN_83289-1 [Araneus ventricosus]
MLKSTSGLAVSFIWNCFQCEYTHEFSSSEFHEGTQVATINTRYVHTLRSIGKGAEADRMFCAVVNLPQPLQDFKTTIQDFEMRLGQFVSQQCRKLRKKPLLRTTVIIILLWLLTELGRSEITRHTMV